MSIYKIWSVQVLYDEKEIEAESPEVARYIAERMYQETGELNPSDVVDGGHGVSGHDEWLFEIRIDSRS